MVTFAEVLAFDPEQLRQIFDVCGGVTETCGNLAGHLGRLDSLHTWAGETADAARTAAGRTRVDIDSHGQEVQSVGVAAKDCYDEAVDLRNKAKKCEDAAAEYHLVIDGQSGAVTDPRPPDMSNWSEPDKTAYQQRVSVPQQAVNDVILDAERFDKDLAALINVADGTIPMSPPNDSGSNEAARRANQIAAFKQVYGREPNSENDWRMADSLDPHTYDPKYNGVESNVVVARFEPTHGAGVFRENMYIPSAEVQNMDLNPIDIADGRLAPHNFGDNRGPSPTVSAEASRVSIYADMENGILVARQNPSISTDGKDAGAGIPQVSAIQQKDGSLKVYYSAADPFAPGISQGIARVEGSTIIKPNSAGTIDAGGMVTSYPSNEAYQYRPDGTTRQIFSMEATGSQYGPMVGLALKPDVQVGLPLPDNFGRP